MQFLPISALHGTNMKDKAQKMSVDGGMVLAFLKLWMLLNYLQEILRVLLGIKNVKVLISSFGRIL